MSKNVSLKLNLEQTMKAQRGVEVQLYSFLNHVARLEWVIHLTLRLI